MIDLDYDKFRSKVVNAHDKVVKAKDAVAGPDGLAGKVKDIPKLLKKDKFPNPAFFKAKDQMDLKKQGENLMEFGKICLELFKECDWKEFALRQKGNAKAFFDRVSDEYKELAAMTPAERKDIFLHGEKKLGKLYRSGCMATVRREWRGAKDTAYDFKEWLRMWGMLLGTFSKDLVPALNATFHYRWMISYMCCVGFMDKNTLGQKDSALRMSHLMIYDIFRYVAENLVFLAKGDKKNGNSAELNKKIVLFYQSKEELNMAEFRKALSGSIPRYMLPNEYHREEILKQNNSGKIDRAYYNKMFNL